MKFTNKSTVQSVNILANDHYAAIAYDCSAVTATDGVIKAGTLLPANDATAKGVLLQDVIPGENPNGSLVVHGFVVASKLPQQPDAAVKLPMIQFI